MKTPTKRAHRYTTIGHTIESAALRRDCTSVYQTVEYSEKTARIRVKHETRWQGGRCRTWYFDDQSKDDAQLLLDELVRDGIECLGESDRQDRIIR